MFGSMFAYFIKYIFLQVKNLVFLRDTIMMEKERETI